MLKDGNRINTCFGDLELEQGYHGDTSRTFFCGEVDEGFKRLVKVVFFFVPLCCVSLKFRIVDSG